MDDAVADGLDLLRRREDPLAPGKGLQDQRHAFFVVGDLALQPPDLVGVVVLDGAAFFPDPLDQPPGNHAFFGHLVELVLDRRTAAVDDQDLHRMGSLHFSAQACARQTAVVATISSTLAPRERSLIGLANPWRNGPIAFAPAMYCVNL